MKKVRRYEFGERIAQILGESHRDLRYRVTMLVASGLVPAGGRGPGSPPATPDYAAKLLIGVMAAPQQTHTVEAIRCYQQFEPTATGPDTIGPRVSLRPIGAVDPAQPPYGPQTLESLRFGEALSLLLERARQGSTRADLARQLYGVWVNRGYPAAAIQFGSWRGDQRELITRRYEIPDGSQLPAWLDPEREGDSDPGLLHSVFLPARKLVDIALLTSNPNRRPAPMVNIGSTASPFSKLVHNRRYRRTWERFLTTVNAAEELADRLDTGKTELTEIQQFGDNPGGLRMFQHVPAGLPASAPLVVVLHGCNQTAASYDYGTGWTALADRYGFALLYPQQRRRNNPMRCFNWFKPEHWDRGAGEPASIATMVEHMVSTHDLDPARVHVTGLSAGGAMTSVMLATYPELFAGGAILSGVPYRAATGLQEAFECIFKGRTKPAPEWGDLIRSASAHRGPWPRVSIWHGDADATVKPVNADEIVKQWTHLHGLEAAPTLEREVEGHTRRLWRDQNGEDVVELFLISGMGHGAAVDPDGVEPYGVEAPFMLDVGISSTLQIARFWDLTSERETLWTPPASWGPKLHRRAESAFEEGVIVDAQAEVLDTESDREPPHGAGTGREHRTAEPAAAQSRSAHPVSERPSEPERERKTAAKGRSLDLNGIIRGALDLAGGATGADGGRSPGIAGVDIQGILSKSFEAAGLLKPTEPGDSHRGARTRSIHGIDVAGIIATSLEAAGVLGGSRSGTGAERPARQASPPENWRGLGWKLIADDKRAPVEGPLLFGHAETGAGKQFGTCVRTVSCTVTLGPDPRLRYHRCLDLDATANALTSAGFAVLVDGKRVDEVSVVGMDYTDSAWCERSEIDLSEFALKTVEMTFEVVATANACVEVHARAWVGGIKVEDAVMVTDA